MPRVSRAAKVQQWTDRFARFQVCGQTVAEFCVAEGVSVPSFYQWKRKLAAPVDSAPGELATSARIAFRPAPSTTKSKISYDE
jgi:transposase